MTRLLAFILSVIVLLSASAAAIPNDALTKGLWGAHSFGVTVSWQDGWDLNVSADNDDSAYLRLRSRLNSSYYVEVYAWKSDVSDPLEIVHEFLSQSRAEADGLEVATEWFEGPNGFTPEVIRFQLGDGEDRIEAIYPRDVVFPGGAMVVVVGFDSASYEGTVLQLTSEIVLSGSWGSTPLLGRFEVDTAEVVPTVRVPTPTAPPPAANCSGYSAWRETVDGWLPAIEEARSTLENGANSGSLADPVSVAAQLLDPILFELLKTYVPESATTAGSYLAQAISAYDIGNLAAGNSAYDAFLREIARLDSLCR